MKSVIPGEYQYGLWTTSSSHASIPFHAFEEEIPVVTSVPWWCYLEYVYGWHHGTWGGGEHSMWWNRSCRRCTEHPGGRNKVVHISSTSGSPAPSLGSVLESVEPVRKKYNIEWTTQWSVLSFGLHSRWQGSKYHHPHPTTHFFDRQLVISIIC